MGCTKAVLTGKFMAIQFYFKEQEKHQINSLTLHLWGVFHKWFVPLSEIKTNIQKQETKDEPHTNGSYRIRQISKIMEYTHIHTHLWTKSKESNKNTDIYNCYCQFQLFYNWKKKKNKNNNKNSRRKEITKIWAEIK